MKMPEGVMWGSLRMRVHLVIVARYWFSEIPIREIKVLNPRSTKFFFILKRR